MTKSKHLYSVHFTNTLFQSFEAKEAEEVSLDV